MRLAFLTTIFIAFILVPFQGISQNIKGTDFAEYEIQDNIKTIKVEVVGVDSQDDLQTITDNLKRSNLILDIRTSFGNPYSQISLKTNLDFSPSELRQLLLPLGLDIRLESIVTNDDDLKRQISHNEKTL